MEDNDLQRCKIIRKGGCTIGHSPPFKLEKSMNIIWDISNKCNLNCKHCGAIEKMVVSSELSIQEKVIIAENISEIASKVTLLGGEPLATAGVKDVINTFEKKDVLVEFITNGQFAYGDVKDILDCKNIITILVSLEGLECENDQIRGIGSFKKAVCFFEDIHKNRNPTLKIGITTVITKKNINNIIELMKFYERLGADEIYFNFLDISGRAKENRDELEPSVPELIKAAETIAKFSFRSKCNIYINTGSRALDEFLLLQYGFVNSSIEKRCGALFESLYIDMEGFLYPCRSYNDSKIDLKQKLNLKDAYRIFNTFWGLFIQAENQGNECPIARQRDILKEEIEKKKIHAKYRVVKSAIFENMGERYFIIFPKNNEYVEYSQLGYSIYQHLENNEENEAIIQLIGCSYDEYYNFIRHEILNNRLEIADDEI